MEEVWKDVMGYEGLYEVSSFGDVYSIKNNKNLKQRQIASYFGVMLYKNRIKKNKYTHKLVANAFILNPENKSETNHKDGIKSHNWSGNLEWVTKSENIKHAYENGLRIPPRASLGKFGKDHHRSKKIYQFNKQGELINSYGSVCEANRITGIDRKAISNCANNKTKKSGGYVWSFNDWNNV